MNETEFTRKFMKKLRERVELKDAVIFKHNDFYTAGIPDFSISVNGRTTWWEIKMYPNQVTALQKHFLDKFDTIGFLIVAHKDGKIYITQYADLDWCIKAGSMDEALDRIIGKALNP